MIEQIRFGSVQCYLIGNNKASILVDTADEKHAFSLYRRIKDKNVKLIVLTHGHNDHIGGAATLQNKLNVPIAMHAEDMNLLPDNLSQPLYADSFVGRFILKISQRALKAKARQFSQILPIKDGDSLESFGVSAVVVGLPGHTKGSIGLRFEDTIIAGDAMFHLFGASSARLYTDKTAALQSTRRIAETRPTTVYVGHGKPIPAKTLRRIAEKSEHRKIDL